MSGKLFVNYRRGDDPGYTHALYMQLEIAFAADNVFMDVEGHIKPGDDFVEVINAHVAAADVVLVVIGPRWADLLTVRAEARIDHVVTEIEAALDQKKRVIPVLVGGVAMPRTDVLPKSIQSLGRRHAVELRPDRFKADCQRLVAALGAHFSKLGPPPPSPPPPRLLPPVVIHRARPREIIKDGNSCPEMLVIPAGEFSMGSNDLSDQKPPHRITIERQFAVGRFAVTFDEWDACAKAGGCNGYLPDDRGWGRGKRPAINVSWKDAKAYVAWLRDTTGKRYRLLSEAEWEYCARAGSVENFSWGDAIGEGNANCRDSGSEWGGKQTAPVGSFPPNQWGLYDMHGNIWEWVEDPYHDSYNGAPADGSVWANGSSPSRVLRGGAWSNVAHFLRSASRGNVSPVSRSSNIGFRVARSL